MSKTFFLALLGVVFFCGLCCGAEAPVPSGKLIAEAKAYDNQQVVYEGELVGDILNRGAFVWLNLYDGANAIGAWVSRSLVSDVRHGGGYKMRGDRILVRGIFHRACPVHGGGLDIHAFSVEVLKPGEPLPETMSAKKILALWIFLGGLACLLIMRISQKRRLRT